MAPTLVDGPSHIATGAPLVETLREPPALVPLGRERRRRSATFTVTAAARNRHSRPAAGHD